MGGAQSKGGEPPKVVLVPPLFERQQVDVERFSRLPFDPSSDLFYKRQLHFLFEEYLQAGFESRVHLCSKQEPGEPRSSFIARFSTPDQDVHSLDGEAAFRYQPKPLSVPYTFCQVGLSSKRGEAEMKGCWKAPSSNLFVSGARPLSKHSSFQETRVGATYATSSFLGGVSAKPLHTTRPVSCFAAVGDKENGWKAAVQCEWRSYHCGYSARRPIADSTHSLHTHTPRKQRAHRAKTRSTNLWNSEPKRLEPKRLEPERYA